jgi:hypothetical protein
VTFLHHFDVDSSTLSEDLRVNIVDLIRVTASTPLSSIPIVFSTISDAEKGGERGSLQLGEMRAHALVALSEFSRKHPGIETESCSAIWMDGRGRIVEVMCGDVHSDPSEHIDKYSPYEIFGRDIKKEYAARPADKYHEIGGIWQNASVPEADYSFDGSMDCYLGYLQRVILIGEAYPWAQCCKCTYTHRHDIGLIWLQTSTPRNSRTTLSVLPSSCLATRWTS